MSLDLSVAWKHFPVIETQRLRLREMTVADTADHLRLWGDAQVMVAHGRPPFTEEAQSQRMIAWYATAFADQEAIRWAVTRQGDNRLIGTIGYHQLDLRHHHAEIGYELLPAFWGQGIMTEAVTAVLHHAFTTMKLHRVEAIVDPANQRSAGLLRKVGFTEEGYLRERFYDNGRFVDDWFFSILAHEFLAAVHT